MRWKREFWKNVLPSMVAFAFTGIYAIVDGFFVGRNVGDAGLAAINVAFPLVALLQASGAGLGMAGAVQIAINKGKKDQLRERRYLGNALVLLVLAGILLTLLLQLTYRPLLEWFGASGEILDYGADYIRIIAAGSVFQVFSTGMVPLIRNYEGAVMAMSAMVAGFITNILGDWYLVSVEGYGVAGAAAATIAGQIVTVIPCIWYLVRKVRIFRYACFKLSKETIKYLLLIAISPFGLTLSPNLVILIMNKGAVTFGGDLAVSCYAVVSYVICVVQLLVQGIGDGAQPLIGRYYGSRELDLVKKVRKTAYIFAAAVTAVSIGIILATKDQMALVFGVSEPVSRMYSHGILYFATGLIFGGFLRITISYFYAVEKNVSAYILIYGEAILLTLFMAGFFPRLFGTDGVWMAPLAEQMVLAAAGILLLKKSKVRV